MNVLVTGSSSGIGMAVARAIYDQQGEGAHRVVGTYLTGKSTYPKSGPAGGVGFKQVQWDVREQWPFELAAYAGMCKAFIHCAGITYLAPYEKADQEQVKATLDTNIYGTINLLSLVARNAAPGAVVVIVTSVAAYTPMRLSAAYNASKAAQDALVRQAAREFGSKFSVIGVRPGYVVDTKLADYVMGEACEQRGMTKEEFHAYNQKTLVTGRYPTMDEVVRTIVWAATEAPAQALTGSFLNPSCGS